jgi:hypothetical protein
VDEVVVGERSRSGTVAALERARGSGVVAVARVGERRRRLGFGRRVEGDDEVPGDDVVRAAVGVLDDASVGVDGVVDEVRQRLGVGALPLADGRRQSGADDPLVELRAVAR